MFRFSLGVMLVALALGQVAAQSADSAPDFKSVYQKHLKTSEDFSLKVAEAMPAENYDFKLTPDQMSFGGQMSHLGGALGYFCSALTGEKSKMAKPASNSKADVIAFLKSSYESAIADVNKLTPEQISKPYKLGKSESKSGYDILLGMLDHSTHHRASAEMYLRAKGVAPPQYDF